MHISLVLREYYDIESRPATNDITSTFGPCKLSLANPGSPLSVLRPGFCQAILGTLRVAAGGVLTLGPPCGSFVWVNRSTSQRSPSRPYGNERLGYVETASLLLGSKIGIK